MKPRTRVAKDVDTYIRKFPKDVQRILQGLRVTIKGSAPQATESISYGIPTFSWHGPLVYFAAFKRHVGFYPTSSPMRAFRTVLSRYKVSRGTIQFPLDRPLPLALVRRIVKFRLKENRARWRAAGGRGP